MTRSSSLTSPGGFSLIEIMVAMVILSMTALSLAPLMIRASRTARGADAMLYEQAVISTEVGRMNALPWAALSPGTACLTSAALPLPHTRCTTVTSVTAKQYRVTVVVTPSASTIKPDTLMFDRTYTSTYNPLNNP
jgi:prepilin-type N-terminal cleavage/methylation domain-containing protein